jgi:hypothetical protein
MRLLIFLGVLLICASGRQAQAKTGRNLLSAEQVRQARENVAKLDWARKSLEDAKKSVEWVLAMPDEDLWEFIPPADQPRALNVRFGFDCPVHGKEIFKKGGHYPWIMDREHPYQVKCPVGGEVYPSNDFDAWYKGGKKGKLDTHQPYVDDGYGWIDKDGNHYWFVAHYIFWQRWRHDILPVIPQLAYIYTLTGDTRYSHKAAVMLARVASEYPKMDYKKQAYHNGVWPSSTPGKLLDLDWEGSGTVVPLATAYDEIYDGIDGDSALGTFLAGKGVTNAKDFIEANFLQEGARAIETGIIHGNMNYQEQLATVASVLDNHDPAKGFTTEQMVDWIMHGPGEMNTLLYNAITRDGSASEESIGYMSIWTNAFYALAEKLKPMGYDLFANPRLRKMSDFYIQAAVAGKYNPNIGDSEGDMVGSAPPVWGADMYWRAYKAWGDPAYAKVLNRVGWPTPAIYEKPDALDKDKAKAKALGTDLGLQTRDLGGYGLAILETGDGDDRRAALMHYGTSGAWHGHLDRLNIEMWSHGRCVLPEMGYPAHWGDKAYTWTQSTPTHYCVEIDENCQKKVEGHLNLLAVTPGMQVMDASAEDAYRGVASLYRRTVAMVDISPADSYLLDVFRVKGGKIHDYIFHGLPFGEFTTDGVTLGAPQDKGTLMGEDVPFGKTVSGMKTGGYQWLTKPRRGKPKASWSANWFVKDKGLGLKMTMLGGSAQEVIVADGEPEAKPDYPEKMEYVLARNDTGASTYVSIIEPYKDKPSIRRATPIKPDGDPRDDLAAVKVDCNGRSDYLFSALDGTPPVSFDSGKIKFAGEFGSISEDNSGMLAMCLVNGSTLRKGSYAIRVKAGSRAKVASVDYKNNCITLDRKAPAHNALVGQVIVISNPQHSASYTVKSVEAKAGRTVMHFGDVSMIEGIGVLKSVDEKAKIVQSSNRLSGYGMKWDGWRIPGRALVNESLTDSWLIADYDNSQWHVKASDDISSRITLTNGKPSKFFYVGEINAGDDVMLPAIASVQRSGTGYVAQGTVPFEFTDAKGKTVKFLQPR